MEKTEILDGASYGDPGEASHIRSRASSLKTIKLLNALPTIEMNGRRGSSRGALSGILKEDV
jgi:hypothetical protein